jgi:alpha-amylase
LHGYYLTEDEGRLLRVFPGSELLRYLIPFRAPNETIDHLRQVAERHPGAVLVFADDGEKFGTWPETKRHVYDNGWLREFFGHLAANRSWLATSTLSEAVSSTPAVGKVYLPEGSYREMTEWSLPMAQQLVYERLRHEMESDPRWSTIRQFVRGGYWRNYKVKYPETDEMYTRMLMVSGRCQSLTDEGYSGELMSWAQRELYRGQCNCAYWHGAFGGVYLPHLRNAVYNHLIAADNLMDRASGRTAPWVEGAAADYNLDGRPEVMLASDRLVCLVAPAAGGHIYELDVRSICHNLQATLTRREEAYHHKIRQPVHTDGQPVASIHDRVVFKQAGLDQHLQYDPYRRQALVDHFYDDNVTLDAVALGTAAERGDFADGTYEAKLRRNPDRVQVQLSRQGRAGEHRLGITKGITLDAGGSTLEIAYLLEGLPSRKPLHFSVELNFAGMPAGADDRYFYYGQHERLGQLGTHIALSDARDLALVDEWLGLDVRILAGRPTNFWTFPVQSVSQSEGGFELVHQSVVVQPHWFVLGDESGRWSVTLKLVIDTTLAESRMPKAEEAVVA